MEQIVNVVDIMQTGRGMHILTFSSLSLSLRFTVALFLSRSHDSQTVT